MSDPAVFVAATAAMAVLAWLEVRRKDRRRLPWRLVATAVAVIALVALAVAPSRTLSLPGGTVVIATEGASGALVEAAADSAGGARVVRLADSIPDAGALRRRIPAATRIVAVGWGLDDGDLARLEGLALEHRTAPLPDGIREIDAPARIALGGTVEIRGVVGTAAARVHLDDAAGPADSARADSAGAFVVRHRPRVEGVARYVLRTGRSAAETLGVDVVARRAPAVLILEAMPGFETSRLRDWIARRGGAVAIRTAISRGRTRVEQVNRAGPLGRITGELLAGFDLVVADGASLAALPAGERAAIERAVREAGLGVYLRADEALLAGRGGSLARFAWVRAGDPEGRRSRLRWTGTGGASSTGIAVGPHALRDEFGVATIVRDAAGRAVTQWRPMGAGRIGVSLVQAPSRWMLEGERESFDGYWSLVVSSLARPRPEWAVEGAAPAFVDQPVVIARGGEIAEQAVIEQPDGSRDTAYLVATGDSSRWAGSWRPRLPGRHRILGRDTAAFYVRGGTEWPALRAARRSAATTRAALASRDRPAGDPAAAPVRGSQPISPVPFFLAFLGAAGWLWWERRAGAGR